MAATDARPVPRKNTAFRVYFPILDADGDPVSAAAGLDSEVSIDGGAFADCVSEATEIGTSGLYYLDLTAGEMNGDAVIIRIQTSTSGAKTTPIIMYPEELGDVRVDVGMISGDSVAADNLEAAADGTGFNLGGGSIVAASVTGNVSGSVASIATGGITAASIAADAIGASELAADAAAEIATAVRTELGTELARIDVASSTRASQTSVTTIDDFLDTEIAQILSDVGTLVSRLTAGRATALDNLDATISSRATPAQVNAEVVDAINVDTYGEPSAAPVATVSLVAKINWLFALARNKITQTSALQTLRNDADSANISTASVSDDGTTFTRGEWA
jgi:hypothetical protein